jgi:uncharacterized membrane protein
LPAIRQIIISAEGLAMAVMLIFAATAHFKFYKGMMLMLPSLCALKKAVYITGYIEILAAHRLIDQ